MTHTASLLTLARADSDGYGPSLTTADETYSQPLTIGTRRAASAATNGAASALTTATDSTYEDSVEYSRPTLRQRQS